MKKTLSVVLSLIMIISTMAIAPFSANAAIGGYCGTSLTWRFTGDDTITISGTGAMDDMEANKQPWVDYKNKIQSITIESGVTTIGAYAFHQLTNLKNVTIPNTVTTIGLQAFGECTGLESLVIPSSVTKIYSYALWNVSCNVYYSGSETSSNNWGATKNIIKSTPFDFKLVGDTLTISGSGAMHDYNIDKNDLPPWADKQDAIKKVVIENGITTIGELAFSNFDSLEEVVMADSVTSIGALAFSWCGSLKKVTFSSNLQAIGDGAFVGCESLTSVSLPNTLTTIGEAAFNYAGIQVLNVPSSVTKIGIAAFGDIPLVNYTGTATDPEGENWRAKSINGYIENNLLYKDKSKTFLVAGLNYKSSYTIPNTVEVIGDSAFMSNDLIKSITIPDSVKVIEEFAFFQCTSLANVTWSKNLVRISNSAFRFCTNLKALSCANSLITIEDYAFADCMNLTDIKLNFGLKSIGEAAFSCVGAKSIYVPCSVDVIGNYAFEDVPAVYYSGRAGGKPWNAKAVKVNNSTSSHKATTTVKKATTTQNGSKVVKCSNCGRQLSSTTIYYPKTITLSTTKYTYDGNVKKPTVKVVDANGKAISSSNYTVTYPSGRKLVGKYTYKITFKGNYSGTVSKSFTIVPKSTTISSLTTASKGFTVKWNKQATQTTGYQIRYSTSSSMTSAKTVTVSGTSTVSKKITGLTGGKKYYVQVRTYKTVNGVKYYSSWSTKKYVTTKK